MDNPDPELFAAVPPAAPVSVPVSPAGPDPAMDPQSTAEQIQQRLQAIRLMRELEPKRACYADRVRDLSRQLTQLPGDSVHYRAVLDKLRDAHSEWQALEEKLWAAQYVLRSTQWLVDLLADPQESLREEAKAGESQ
jgi:hypothetical protein